MFVLMLVKTTLLTFYINAVEFIDLNPEILDVSLSFLPLRQQMKVRHLNHGCNNCFEQKNKFNIIQTRMLERLIQNNDILNHVQLKLIQDVSHKIQLTELYSNKLPNFILTCYCKLIDKSNIMTGNDFALLMNSLNLHSISISEFDTSKYQKLSSELRCLLLSSRALLHHLAPTRYININASSDIDDYPWLLFADNEFDDNIVTEYIVYFCLLYQYVLDEYHAKLVLPSLDSMHHADGIERLNVLQLINEYGFIPWNRNSIQLFINQTIIGITNDSYVRSLDYFDQFFTDGMFMQDVINMTEMHEFVAGFRTNWMLYLLSNDMMNWGEYTDWISLENFMIELCWYNFDVGKYDRFGKLVYYLANSPNRHRFNINNAIYYDPFNGFYSRFIQLYMESSGDESYLETCNKEQLILYYKSISNYYYFQENDTQTFIDTRVAYCHLYDSDEPENIINDCYSYLQQNVTLEEQKLYFRTSCRLIGALLKCRDDWNIHNLTIHQDIIDLDCDFYKKVRYLVSNYSQ
eukprot:385869_1